MNPGLAVPIVAILSLFIGLPLILVAAGVARRYLKIKERELDLRAQELIVERERVTVLRLLDENERRDEAFSRKRKD